MEVRVNDARFRELLRQTKNDGRSIDVGVLGARAGETPEGADATIGDIALFHEVGTITIPQRSFIRAWVEANQPAIRDRLRAEMVRVFQGKSTRDQAMARFGAWAVGEVQKNIASNIPPPLAESTIAAKGSDVSLIDSGALRSAITFVIRVVTEG